MSKEDIQIECSIGKIFVSLQELEDIKKGTSFELNEIISKKVDLLVDGKVIAKGEIVNIGDENRYGVLVDHIENK